jgi:hypothetical protein
MEFCGYNERHFLQDTLNAATHFKPRPALILLRYCSQFLPQYNSGTLSLGLRRLSREADENRGANALPKFPLFANEFAVDLRPSSVPALFGIP